MNISVLINSRDRPQVLARCLCSVLSQSLEPAEILVLDDASSTCRLAEELGPLFNKHRLRFIRSEQPLGVSAGRNWLMAEASGDAFCFIDDDAFFADDTALMSLASAMAANSRAAIIATKVFDHYPSGRDRLYLPFTQRAIKQNLCLIDQPQLVSYYLGTCHAIRREVISQCGAYRQATKFGEEELELSYRAIEAGFEIVYLPQVVVHHYPQPSVITTDTHKQPELYYHVQNRFLLAYKYLPWRYVPVYVSIWLVRNGVWALGAGAVREFMEV